MPETIWFDIDPDKLENEVYKLRVKLGGKKICDLIRRWGKIDINYHTYRTTVNTWRVSSMVLERLELAGITLDMIKA